MEQKLHTESFWLAVVSVVLTVLVKVFGVLPASDSLALYRAAGIVVSLLVANGVHAAAIASNSRKGEDATKK